MTTQPRRERTRAGTARPVAHEHDPADRSVEVDLDGVELVEEVELGAAPSARIAVHDVDGDHVVAARAAIAELGHTAVVSGAGAAAAQRILRALRDEEPAIDLIVVGLPGGEAIVDAARALAPRRPVLVAAVAGPAATAPARAHAAGADLVTRRPHDVDRLGPVLMAAAALARARGEALTAQAAEARLRAQLARAGEVDRATGLLAPELFRRILELELRRARRYGYALSVVQLGVIARGAPAAVVYELKQRAAAAIAGSIRDIDFPTELADDRFVVLLPYTDAAGAAHVARRAIAAVAAAPAVRAVGQAWAPAVAAGVAGAGAGEPVSVARLLRDAGEALRAARKRGVDLVVTP